MFFLPACAELCSKRTARTMSSSLFRSSTIFLLVHCKYKDCSGQNSRGGLFDQLDSINDQPACALWGKMGRGNYLCSSLTVSQSRCQQRASLTFWLEKMPTLLSSLPPFAQGKISHFRSQQRKPLPASDRVTVL